MRHAHRPPSHRCARRTLRRLAFVGASLLAKQARKALREQARSHSRSPDEIRRRVPIHPGLHPGYVKALLSFQPPRNFQATRSWSPRQEAEHKCCAGDEPQGCSERTRRPRLKGPWMALAGWSPERSVGPDAGVRFLLLTFLCAGRRSADKSNEAKRRTAAGWPEERA